VIGKVRYKERGRARRREERRDKTNCKRGREGKRDKIDSK